MFLHMMKGEKFLVVLLLVLATTKGQKEHDGNAKVDLKVDFPPEVKERLPSLSDVSNMYGSQPALHGLERCEEFRNSLAPEDRFLAIAGLYNSGTNMAKTLLENNCDMPGTRERRAKYGRGDNGLGDPRNGILKRVPWHKHGPVLNRYTDNGIPSLKDQREAALIRENLMPVVIVKDPVFWMNSMCRHPYGAMSLHEQTNCPELVTRKGEKVTVTGRLSPFTKDARKFKHDSLVEFWNSFYRGYEEHDKPRLIVRYEDLLYRGPEIVEQICTCAGGVMKADWSPLIKYNKQSKTSLFEDAKVYLADAAAYYSNNSERQNVFKSERDRAYAETSLDKELMELLQYGTP